MLSELEPRLRACIAKADLEGAKALAARIQHLLRPSGHTMRWMQNQNWLCECAIEAGDLAFASQRLEGVRASTSSATRTHLEATTLLAICLVRDRQIDKAKPLISFVINNINRIQSPRRRQQFHRRFIMRLEEESILASLREDVDADLNVDRVQDDAIRMLILDENALVLQLASMLPPDSVKMLSCVRSHAITSLPVPERKLLPAPHIATAPVAIGERARAALKRVTWRAVCDPEDEIYQAWSKGLSVVYDKK